jgi:acetylornithine aminotransferase
MANNIIPFYNSTDKILVKSNDCYLYDSEGEKYIDFESGVWCANIGHNNKSIIKTIKGQAEESIHHGYAFRNKQAEKLSDELLRISGIKQGSSVFLSSGSEVVDLSIKLAFHLTNRRKILKIDTSYLSAYGFGKPFFENDYIVNIPFDDLKSIKDINYKEIAAFVLETGNASMGVVRFPEYNFIKDIIKKVQENDCLVIAEEVTTGMGRTGKWFGFQHYNIIPDILVTGKALGNGYPVSAVTINEPALKHFNENPFAYAQSHQNDPLGCSIGISVINIIEKQELVERSFQEGIYFKGQLEGLKDKYPEIIKDIRGRGLMLAIEFNSSVNGEKIYKQLFNSGFIIGFRNNTLRFMPPLTIIRDDIDLLISKIKDSVGIITNSIEVGVIT